MFSDGISTIVQNFCVRDIQKILLGARGASSYYDWVLLDGKLVNFRFDFTH